MTGFKQRFKTWFFQGLNEQNAVVVWTSAQYILANPDLITTWKDRVMEAHHSVGTMFLLSALLFPKLALGLSGLQAPPLWPAY